MTMNKFLKNHVLPILIDFGWGLGLVTIVLLFGYFITHYDFIFSIMASIVIIYYSGAVVREIVQAAIEHNRKVKS